MSDAQPVSFGCEGATLQGMLHAGTSATGVLVVVGGPQYRVGSHRQFVLLSRALAARGVPVLRFDYRGLGDSAGDARTFESIDQDIRAAVDAFFRLAPHLERVVIWGLCDAASAALFYAPGDRRIAGLVLLNPWVRSSQTVAQAYLKSYYARRVLDPRAWRDLILGGKLIRAVGSFVGLVRQARGADATGAPGHDDAAGKGAPAGERASPAAGGPSGESGLVQRMRRGFGAFKGPVLVILSGDDITAEEFRTATRSAAWRKLLDDRRRVSHCALEAADHTFSSRAWRDQVAAWTGDWVDAQWPVARQAVNR